MYCGAVVRAVRVDAVTSAYVAPVDETTCVAPIGSAAPNVTVRVDGLVSVTTEPPDVPLETTETDCIDGNVYMFVASTVTAAVVRVLTNVHVNVVSAADAVTVAPRTLLADSVVPKVTVAVVASVRSALVVEPEANAPKFPSIVAFELLNEN